MDQLETLEETTRRKAARRGRKRKPKMKVSGKSVLTLKRIIVKKGRA